MISVLIFVAVISQGSNPHSKLILIIEFDIDFNIKFDFGFNIGGRSELPYTIAANKNKRPFVND